MNTQRVSITGGVIAAVILCLAGWLLGGLHGQEALVLLEKSIRGFELLCNTIILACATILALLLTLLSVSIGTKVSLKQKHYVQIRRLATADTVVLITAVIIFQLLNIPITKAENVPTDIYDYIYWATLGITSILCGAFIFVVLLLYTTFRNLVDIVGFDGVHRLQKEEEEKEVEES
jgi:uncharacterized protein YybS (DUF2232 family)